MRTSSNNEPSAVFSLEVLARQARAQTQATERRRTRLATTVVEAGSSGRIDLKTMCGAGTGDGSGSLLGGGGTLLSPASRLATPATPKPSGPSRTMLGAIAALSGAAIVLGTLAVMEPAAVVVERPAAPDAGSLAVASADPDATEGDAEHRTPRRKVKVVATRPADPAPEPEAEATPPEEAAPQPAPRAKGTSRARARATSTSTSTPTSTPTPASTPASTSTPTPTSKAPSDLPVECILDPARCSNGKPKAKAPTTGSPASDLPQKPSTTQIRNALARPKNAAKQCNDTYAAPAGTKVQVKLSIDGDSGLVTKATPLAPHATALGKCIAGRLSEAKFPKFSKPAIGVVYSVRL